MNKKIISANHECLSCSRLSQNKCCGKKSVTPCIAYVSNKQYAANSIEAIKQMIKR